MPKTIQKISDDSQYQDLDTNVLDLIDYVGATELRTNFQYRSIYDTVYRLCVAIGDNTLTNGIPYHHGIEDTVRLIILKLLMAGSTPVAEPLPAFTSALGNTVGGLRETVTNVGLPAGGFVGWW